MLLWVDESAVRFDELACFWITVAMFLECLGQKERFECFLGKFVVLFGCSSSSTIVGRQL